MILGDPTTAAAAPAPGPRQVTFDSVFGHAARRRPDALALIDAVNRRSFTDGEPHRLTYAEADRAVSAIAARLRGLGLPTDAIVGVQLPNIAENILAILGILRADMIAAPLPVLWRRADAVTALARVGAKALITCGHVGRFNHGQFALRVAAEVFSIRYVCGFGANLPDGVVPFDDVFAAEPSFSPSAPAQNGTRDQNASAHVAVLTFDIGEGGPVPVARSHSELFAAGLALVLESRLPEDARILSTLAPSSFAGLCLTLLPWLMSGGALVLHQPFAAEVLLEQRRREGCGTLIVPATLAFRLADVGAFAAEAPASVFAVWRSPERLGASVLWPEPSATLIDVQVFGEAVLLPARRGSGGKPCRIPFGPFTAPCGSAAGVAVAELFRTESGTLAARGPMIPHRAFPPGIERSGLPYFKVGPHGLVDTGYTCRVDPTDQAFSVTGPPTGIVSIGGYRFALRDLQDVVGRIDGAAMLAALPDRLTGQRLVGYAADRATMRGALDAVGVNPLVTAAFGHRRGPPASATGGV